MSLDQGTPQVAAASSSTASQGLSRDDLVLLHEAARLADSTAGLTQPHPNAACILVGPDGRRLSSAYQLAQGTLSAELQAVVAAGGAANGATAYINLECGDCHGDAAAVRALIAGKLSRVVVGLRHPFAHARGTAVRALRAAGLRVDVLSDAVAAGVAGGGGGGGLVLDEEGAAAWDACLRVNEALVHRAVLRRPLSLLKYAMTLDGKIATRTGHSAWVTSPPARALVFEQRARSDAVIVGGNTVRRDNPRLTTRREGGHVPVRICMSRTLDLPADAALWDVSVAPTIVMTQKGARTAFQAMLRSRGVEVVEFDFLTPENVADYCYDRGFLQCFWECGGVLSAPAISSNVIHKVLAFVAPKIIGGDRAPTPVGDLGFVEMTQAVSLGDVAWRMVGPDMLFTGFLPTSNGPHALEASLSGPEAGSSGGGSSGGSGKQQGGAPGAAGAAGASSSGSSGGSGGSAPSPSSLASSSSPTPVLPTPRKPPGMTGRAVNGLHTVRQVATFYKAWDRWGSLGNFSPHSITLPPLAGGSGDAMQCWASVEHFYQASKFRQESPEGRELSAIVASAASPEEAARLGRAAERTRPELVRPDWKTAKLGVMGVALRAKFAQHDGPREMLLASAPLELVESSPHDFFWGQGYDGSGANQLGCTLMAIREELQAAAKAQQQQQR
ncbi:hypothetical protein FOA52_005884 [Chlamydomonas sp. UWO 241]|nr:hypothetical protein FOA52_005884 [Chlamydomonas sp. UWO 241]